MKLTLKSCAAALILVFPISLIGIPQSHAAGSPSFSTLAKITNQALNDAHASDIGEVCVTVDGFGTHTDTTSKSLPAKDYSGNQGDLWIYMEPFELEMFQYRYFYWDGSNWIDGTGYDENGDESETNNNALWNQYHTDHWVMVQEAQESKNGYKCKFSKLSRIEIFGQDPSPTYKGQIGDFYIKLDSTFTSTELQFLWTGTKWLGNLENPYTLSHIAATKSKTGEYCTYGKNKDVYSSYYSIPPKTYTGVKGDLWIVADKKTGKSLTSHYWDGKTWVQDSAPEAAVLKKLNDAAQFKARNSTTGEVCHSGTVTSTQTFSAKLPAGYKGKVNDRWIVMEKDNSTPTSYNYWTGKSWVLN